MYAIYEDTSTTIRTRFLSREYRENSHDSTTTKGTNDVSFSTYEFSFGTTLIVTEEDR